MIAITGWLASYQDGTKPSSQPGPRGPHQLSAGPCIRFCIRLCAPAFCMLPQLHLSGQHAEACGSAPGKTFQESPRNTPPPTPTSRACPWQQCGRLARALLNFFPWAIAAPLLTHTLEYVCDQHVEGRGDVRRKTFQESPHNAPEGARHGRGLSRWRPASPLS